MGTNAWTVTGVGSDSSSYEVTLATKPGPTSAFPYTGVVGSRSETTTTAKVDGVAEAPFVSYIFYDASTLSVFGDQAVTDGSCSTASSGPMLPTAVGIGAGGSLYDTIDYETCVAPSVVDGTTVVTWSLESDNGNVLFCFNAANRTPTGSVSSTESYCVQTGQDGTLGTKARISIVEGGFSLTARN